jgi:surfactin synthase thioesterase subunit
VFAPWGDALPDGVELLAVRLPGREARYGERPLDRLPALLDEVAAAVDLGDGVPLTLFGHSWGAIVGFELARRFQCGGGPDVVHLVASGARAPHLPSPLPPLSHLPRAQFVDGLAAIGGIHPELLAHEDFLDLMIPTLRADLRMVEAYRLVPGPALSCPITVFGATGDPMTTPDQLDAWREHTTESFHRTMFTGGHFYLLDNPAPLLTALAGLFSC